jgi:hypothetical protein
MPQSKQPMPQSMPRKVMLSNCPAAGALAPLLRDRGVIGVFRDISPEFAIVSAQCCIVLANESLGPSELALLALRYTRILIVVQALQPAQLAALGRWHASAAGAGLLASFRVIYTLRAIDTADEIARWSALETDTNTWLIDEMSEHERHLASFGCFTAFSAQLVLNCIPLRELLAMSTLQRSAACPWLSETVWISFEDALAQEKQRRNAPPSEHSAKKLVYKLPKGRSNGQTELALDAPVRSPYFSHQ